ncbi:MAG: BadF/BadG/BcrA/BcrD ATPase family protein [Terracidiphilus sp.]
MAYFLAVDAGGTKAEFLLAEGERELARVICGTIKRLNATEEEAAEHLDDALTRLEGKTGVRLNQIARTCIGTSGNTVPLVTDWLRENFIKRVSGAVQIVGDVDIALDAVFPGDRGVLVLSGTGSNVAGRGADGAVVTAGGWGPMLADQGAGHWIGLEALRRGFLAIDQQRQTLLLERARQAWQLPSVKALIECANAEPRPHFAELVPLVVECAHTGDAIAASILEQAGTDLASLAQLVIDRIQLAEGGHFSLPGVAIAGSVLGKIDRVRETLMAALRARYAAIQFIVEPSDPVLGALYHARSGA